MNLPAIRNAVAAVPGIAGPAAEAAAGKLAEALDVSLADMLAEAWYSHQEIQRAARDSLRRPGKTLHVPLAAHKLTSSRLPSVEVAANGQAVHRLVFDLRISLKLEGAVLQVRDGKIREVAAGNCQGEGQIRLGQNVLARRQPQKFKLRGPVGLGEGLTIPGIEVQAA